MKNYVVENYENYREEERLTTNNARKIEFITTARVMDKLLSKNLKVLDCAAGTGIYAFYLADRGYEVTASDITPRHIEVIKDQLKNKSYSMRTAVLDAADMSIFEDESFDVVLNMGPFYHLTEEEQRMKCLSESLRVLKKGGILITAYIPRFFVFQFAAMNDSKFLDRKLAEQIVETGVLRHDDEKCFWTDTYYSCKSEMEQLYVDNSLEVIDHFAQDGLAPLLAYKVDSWSEEEFKVWCDYHYSVCREESTLGASNHVVIAGRKV
ncbi:MAG: class I SAM-dependent methyltransferase [Eubacteriales bacterium]|nr:class I SAM-dependent methyltransferase [Eubacteriales bacterium]